MTVLEPLWMLLAAAGVLVVLLHIRRRRSIDVASIQLWRQLASDQSSNRSIKLPKPSLPLFLQLLALLLLALALSRPVFGDGPTAEHWVVLVDVSGSMLAVDAAGEQRFNQATAELVRTLATTQLGRGRVTSLLQVGTSAEWLGFRTAIADEARAAVARLVPSEGGAAWAQAASMLANVLVGDEALRIMVLTDGAGAVEARTVLAERLPVADLDIRTFGGVAANAALRAVEITPIDADEGRWQVAGEVALFGEAEPQLGAWFAPGDVDDALPWADIPLRFRDGVASFDIALEVSSAGLLELRLSDDALDYDNRYRTWLSETPLSLQVLHVGPDNPPLIRALHAVGSIEVFESESLPADAASFDLVIVDRVASEHPGTDTLWLVGPSLATEGSPPLQSLRPSGWDVAHPLSSSVDWSAVEISVAYRVPRLTGATVLFEANGFPLVQARDTGVGREVVVAFDLLSSPWIQELGFPVFVANLVRWVEPRIGTAQARVCRSAAPCPLDPALLFAGASPMSLSMRAGVDSAPSSDVAAALPSPYVLPSVGDFSAQNWTVPAAGELWRPQRSGLYRMGENGSLLVVNPESSSESDLTVVGTANTTAADMARSAWPIFRWLLLLALIVLLVEGWAAGRGQDRFLRRPSLHRDNPLALRRRRILALRVVTLLLLLLALVDLPLVRPVRDRHAVLVIDNPALYGSEVRALLEGVVAAARREAGPGRRLDIVRLGVTPQLETDGAATDGGIIGSDVAAALSFGAALLGSADSGTLRLVSSGVETRGDLAAALRILHDRGIALEVLPLAAMPPGEVLVERLLLPPRLTIGESFLLQATLRSEMPVQATVQVWRESEPYETLEVMLRPGRNLIEIEFDEQESGRFLYEVEVSAPGDSVADNNRLGAVATVVATARTLVVASQTGVGEVLTTALGAQGIDGDLMVPEVFPYKIEELLGYDSVILMNVPSIDLHVLQQELLASWVRDHGGGLLLLGGENTFGPGGYYQTPLEEISPLSSRIPEEAPKVAMLFVLDRSGSMQQLVGGISRLDIAKSATIGAVELLHQESVAGVVVFDELATTLLPLVPVGNGEVLRRALAPLVAGGGTAIQPALVLAYQEFATVTAEARHIVLMTDGLSQPAFFGPVLQKFAADEITVSTVAISSGADMPRLQEIARLGGGTFHTSTDVRSLPSILAQEALLLSSSPIEEVMFVPRWQARDTTFLAGLPDLLPALEGYVRTSAKEGADVHLLGPNDDPLLASWRYGLGRVVTFASHGVGSWSRGWVNDPLFPLLWSQAVRWALPPVKHPGLHLALFRDGDELRLVVEAIGSDGAPEAGLLPIATLSLDGAALAALPLGAAGTGRYQGSFLADEPGRYHIEVALETPKPPFDSVDAELAVSYPARYAFGAQGGDVLQVLASASGGRMLLGDEPLFAAGARIRWVRIAGWPWWVLIAVAMLLAELVLRYAPSVFSLGVRRVQASITPSQLRRRPQT